MKIPFICVNYNTPQETIKFIKNVKSLEESNSAIIIVVDNSPTNESLEILQKFVDDFFVNDGNIILLKKENKGYFQGLNEGIMHAKQLLGTDYYFVVGNNDIIFEHDFITQLITLQIEKNILVLAPDVVTTQKSHENPHVIERMGFLRKLKYDVFYSHYWVANVLSKLKSTERKHKDYDPFRKEIHMGIGALYVLTPAFFKHFEKLSEEVFLYGEEAILAGQISSVDGKTVYEPRLVCYHNESTTTSALESKLKYKIIQKSYKTYKKYL